MRIFDLARRPPHWLRVALAAVLLSFAINSIAHAAHSHEATTVTAAHHLACGYCATFGAGLVDAPVHAALPPAVMARSILAAAGRGPDAPDHFLTSTRARAPPVS